MTKINQILITGLLGATLAVGFIGCAKSQQELKIEKQKKLREKQRKEQVRKKKFKEAKKYLNLKNNNNQMYNLFYKINSKFKHTIYETDAEYKNRIKTLKHKYFSKKFIFDYTPKYRRYDAKGQVLFLSLATFDKTSKIQLEEKFLGTKTRNGYRFNQKRHLLTKVPSNFQWGYKKNYVGQSVLSDLYTPIKYNCPPKKAQEIQSNWTIRFISNINFNGLRLKGGWTDINDYNDEFVNTTMIIVYNKKTNEIYNVIY